MRARLPCIRRGSAGRCALRGVAGLAGLLAVPALASAQRAADSATSAPVTELRYEVTADRAPLAARRLRVATSFDVAGDRACRAVAARVDAGRVRDQQLRAAGWAASPPRRTGAALQWDKLDYDSWRVRPAGAGRVTVRFDFLADTLDNAMAWTRPDFALFNGTNLFLYPEGRRQGVSGDRGDPDRAGLQRGDGHAVRRRGADLPRRELSRPRGHAGVRRAGSTSTARRSPGSTVRFATYPVGHAWPAPRARARGSSSSASSRRRRRCSARCRGTATR